MPETYLSDNELARRFGVARGTVWRWAREQPGFPHAVKLTPGCARWRLSEIEAWETARAEAAA